MDNEPSLPGFIEWLQRKDPNERYQWTEARVCACGQYATSLGEKEWIGKSAWSKLNMIARGPSNLDEMQSADPAGWTFGQCLERAKKELEPV